MRWGLFGARADRRGLATQTSEFARHLQPDRILGVDLTASGDSPYPCDWTPYRHVDVYTPDELTRDVVQRWTAGLDVVVAHETFYVDEVPDWIRTAGARSLLVANPEFYRHRLEPIPAPDRVVTPTRWLHGRMDGADVLPIPVDCDAIPRTPRPQGEPLTFLHVGGHRAAYDRDGIVSVIQAAKLVRRPCRLLVRSQQKITLPRVPNKHVDVKLVCEDVADYRELYSVGDVMLLPRRYGGQSLKVQEAAAAAIPSVMTDVVPQSRWLPDSLLVDTTSSRQFDTQNGPVQVHNAKPPALAAAMDRLSDDLDLVEELSEWAGGWADRRSWSVLKGRWMDLIRQTA